MRYSAYSTAANAVDQKAVHTQEGICHGWLVSIAKVEGSETLLSRSTPMRRISMLEPAARDFRRAPTYRSPTFTRSQFFIGVQAFTSSPVGILAQEAISMIHPAGGTEGLFHAMVMLLAERSRISMSCTRSRLGLMFSLGIGMPEAAK